MVAMLQLVTIKFDSIILDCELTDFTDLNCPTDDDYDDDEQHNYSTARDPSQVGPS